MNSAQLPSASLDVRLQWTVETLHSPQVAPAQPSESQGKAQCVSHMLGSSSWAEPSLAAERGDLWERV